MLLPNLVGVVDWCMYESVGKTDLLSDNFDIEQASQSVDLPLQVE